MFRTISENPNKPAGKYQDHNSVHGKANHYSVGNDNEMVGAISTLQSTYVDHNPKGRRPRCEPAAPQINLGDFKTDFNSNSMRSYL